MRAWLDEKLVADRRRVHEDRRVVAGGRPARVAAGDEAGLSAGTLERCGDGAGGTAPPEDERAPTCCGDRRGNGGPVGVEARDPALCEDERVHDASAPRDLVELVAELRGSGLVRHGHVGACKAGCREPADGVREGFGA